MINLHRNSPQFSFMPHGPVRFLASMNPSLRAFALLVADSLLAMSGLAQVQQKFPTKPIRFVVPFSPGGGTDTLARIIAQKMSENWGQSVVIENRTGAGAWYGVLAPAATPRAIVERLNSELVRILKLPDIQQRLRNEAYEVIADTPDQFAAAIRAEIAKWAPLVTQAGLRAE